MHLREYFLPDLFTIVFESRKIGIIEVKNVIKIGIFKIRKIEFVYPQNIFLTTILRATNSVLNISHSKNQNKYILIRNKASYIANKIDIKKLEETKKGIIYGDSIINYQDETWYESRPIFSPYLYRSEDYIGDIVLTNFKVKNFNYLRKSILGDKVDIFKENFAISLRYSNKVNKYNVPILYDYGNLEYEKSISITNKFSISVIIPTNFSAKDKFNVTNCIKSLIKISSGFNLEIIIVHKNKDDFKFESLSSELKEISQIVSMNYSGNFNFSKAINMGVERAMNENILILNDDVIFDENSDLKHLLNHLDSITTLGCIGIRLTDTKGKILHAGHEYNEKGPQHFLNGSELEFLKNVHGKCREVSGVTAAVLFMTKNIFKKVNGMNENFPNDFNDVDLMLKLTKKGYNNFICSGVNAQHSESMSRGVSNSIEISESLSRLIQNHGKFSERDPYLFTVGDRIKYE
jgi:GT2 family glycosyltransferase